MTMRHRTVRRRRGATRRVVSVGARRAVGAAAALSVLAVAGCGSGGEPPRFLDASPSAAGGTSSAVTLTVTPEDGAGQAPLSTEIGVDVTGGDVTDVTLADDGGDVRAGALRDDGTAWVPDRPLEPSTTYTATVTATGPGGATATAETTFTTMAEPDRVTDTGLYLFDDREYGVAMPVVVEFVQPVPQEARAGVQRRMFVETDPPQPGVWHWVPDGSQAFYRAPEYWQPGTVIDVRIALAGHPTGDGRYGDTDRRATASIADRKVEMVVDNASKQMSVYVDDEREREIPVSLGKPSTPSSSGTMVVMSRERETVFDTYDELGPEEGYRMDIEYAMRLTWGGEYIHAAPWSVADQGVRNVSHGCVNVSMSAARWLFDLANVGDPVTVVGTERELTDGNGWTAWNMDWDEFVAGSALPVSQGS